MEVVALRIGCLVALSALLGAGCGADDDTSAEHPPVAAVEPSGNAGPGLLGAGEDQVGQPARSPAQRALPPATAAPIPPVETASRAKPGSGASVAAAWTAGPVPGAAPAPAAALLRGAQGSPFHVFGNDVYTWDADRQIVILEIPVGHESLTDIRVQQGYPYGTVEDTPGTRAWTEQCARRYTEDALAAPAAAFGAISAQGVYSCLGGLVHLGDLLARYWWAEEGLTCLANAVSDHSRHGDDRIRPLALCPSIGYRPAEPRPRGWLKQRCEEIVAANPNSGYPTDSSGIYRAADPLPTCWEPLLDVIEAHAAEGAEIGLPDSPHHCYHAFLGYAWARQTGREGRPPSDLAIGCHYRAFEAAP